MSAQPTEHSSRPAPSGADMPLRTLGDIRAALRAGRGFPGDREDFELDLTRALENSTETDLSAVAAVMVDYRGRVRLASAPDYDVAMQEGEELLLRIKAEAAER
ncbi:hypothetical protein [Streptomyces sp. NPDC093795]|uniref:hypothetical protein n=1 Tax=Streptomyces sp. NPDC093795 TaxID=3366051 RepID=UPI003801A466